MFVVSSHAAEQVEAAAVFAGYGLTVPELKYDDLAGQDVKGKIVVFVTGGPPGMSAAGQSALPIERRAAQSAAQGRRHGHHFPAKPQQRRSALVAHSGIAIPATHGAEPTLDQARRHPCR